MSRATADALWGSAAVDHALADPHPDDPTNELTDAIRAHEDPPGAFRAWTLAQPWPRFCAVVRIVAGVTRKELLRED